MSNIRLFFSESLSINLNAKLDKFQSHYVNKVMRVKVNETFSLFNSSGEWEAKINVISKGIVEFNITKKLREKENSKEIWLAFSPIKSNYFNFMIQKATELGVTKFIPIITDRTIIRKINSNRLEKIIIESSEQSNRLKIPILEKVIPLENFIKYNQKLNIIFGDLNTDNKKINTKKLNNNNPICILIGPEGDFTEEERQKILELKNIQCLKINNNILRAETAAISMISIVNFNFLS
jgi:16S rRNA (uracil1498-N3)-methyltransferase